MSSGSEQLRRPAPAAEEERTNEERTTVGVDAHYEIPWETSPYVQYKDLEDYKRKGYGTEGHLPVVDRQPGGGGGGGGTEAPTISGSGISGQEQLEHVTRRALGRLANRANKDGA